MKAHGDLTVLSVYTPSTVAISVAPEIDDRFPCSVSAFQLDINPITLTREEFWVCHVRNRQRIMERRARHKAKSRLVRLCEELDES